MGKITEERQRQFDISYLKMCHEIANKSVTKRQKEGAIAIKDGTIISSGFINYGNDYIKRTEIPYSKIECGFLPNLECDTNGNIWYKGKLLKIYNHCTGKYCYVSVGRNRYKVHSIIANTFIKNPDPLVYNQINHINWDDYDNRLANLEFCTNRYNCIHRSSQIPRHAPYGVHFDKERNKWVGQSLTKEGYHPKRFYTMDEAVEYAHSLLDEKELTTYRYYGENKDLPIVASHIEQTIFNGIKKGTIGFSSSTLYTTTSPDEYESNLILLIGIKRVVYDREYRITDGIDLLKKHGIQVEHIKIEP